MAFGKAALQCVTVRKLEPPLTRMQLLGLFLRIVWRILRGPECGQD